MEKNSIEFLKSLIGAMSPSGFEEDAAKLWKGYVSKFVDNVTGDVHGNSIGVINPDGRPRVMLSGHIDEIGYMIKYINKNGYLFFATIGGIDIHIMPGERVLIKGNKGKVLGVIGRAPIHTLEKEERERLAKIDELFIDIGVKDKKEAEKLVSIGDPAVPAVSFEELHKDRVIARGFDDRAGAFVVAETLRLCSNKKMNASVYGVATVQEEVGLRGAKTSAFRVSPDVGIAIDVTFATDYPKTKKEKIGDINIGKGPVIARGPNINPKVFNMLVETAKAEKIPHQIEGIPRGTGTDANVIQLTKEGVATGLVSIPNRYMHTPIELVSTEDLINASKLLAAFIKRLSKKTDFIPF
ncbi:M42 family metallopeptidase [candidate division WOR-3 bacterium]|nr:M42 family metallopeptidase [candidate division WOR-3 bacterium]